MLQYLTKVLQLQSLSGVSIKRLLIVSILLFYNCKYNHIRVAEMLLFFVLLLIQKFFANRKYNIYRRK